MHGPVNAWSGASCSIVTSCYLNGVTATILGPDAARAIVPELAATRNPNVWVYRFTDDDTGWKLSVATHAEPGSGMLSLGGFRIAPLSRTSSPGFTTDREAIALAMGMEEKIHWSRLIGVGGPKALRDINLIVGGKCVMEPTADARIGQPKDVALLDFAVACLAEIERTAGIHITTGQDLGHGLMHDGRTHSLDYMARRFVGSTTGDTSLPTGEGNYQLLHGMLRACALPIDKATIGLIGCGNIGMHIVERLREHGKDLTIIAVEARPDRRAELEAIGIRTWGPEGKLDFLREPMDALVTNAPGGTLDAATIAACAANERLRVVCGSENLAMPEPEREVELRNAKKVFAPTELGGMMGYLAAVEEYLSVREGEPFDMASVLLAARRLESAGFDTTARVIAGGFRESFAEAVTDVYATT